MKLDSTLIVSLQVYFFRAACWFGRCEKSRKRGDNGSASQKMRNETNLQLSVLFAALKMAEVPVCGWFGECAAQDGREQFPRVSCLMCRKARNETNLQLSLLFAALIPALSRAA